MKNILLKTIFPFSLLLLAVFSFAQYNIFGGSGIFYHANPINDSIDHFIDTIDYPIDTIDYPIDTIDYPIDTIDFPIDTIDYPIDTIDYPIDTVDYPIDTIDYPIDTVDYPVDTIDFPIDTINYPIDTIDYPVDTIDYPIDTVDYPIDTIDYPIDTLDNARYGELGIEITDIENKISIYPNPVKNTLYFDFDEAIGIKTISIADINGRIIMSNTYNRKNQLDVGALLSGLYFMIIQTDYGTINKKIIIE